MLAIVQSIAVVPSTRDDRGVCAVTLVGELRTASTADELAELEAAIRFNGMYLPIASAGEVDRHRADPAARPCSSSA